MKKVSIDDLLAKDELILTLGKKDYVVKDVPLDAYLKALSIADSDDLGNMERLAQQLATILGVKEDSFKDVGIKAIGLAVKTINEWMTEETLRMQGEVRESDSNP